MNDMHQLTGEFDCKLDAKGRVRLPANLVRQLSGSGAYEFMVNRGFENPFDALPERCMG